MRGNPPVVNILCGKVGESVCDPTTYRILLEATPRCDEREACRQSTLAAWQEHQETGMHVTGDEVEAWLASWGTSNELPAPKCHK